MSEVRCGSTNKTQVVFVSIFPFADGLYDIYAVAQLQMFDNDVIRAFPLHLLHQFFSKNILILHRLWSLKTSS